MELKVEQRHIDKALEAKKAGCLPSRSCAIVQAARECLLDDNLTWGVIIGACLEKDERRMREFAWHFDCGHIVSPTVFELELNRLSNKG